MNEWQEISSAPIETVILTYGSWKNGQISIVPIVAQKRLRQGFGGGPISHEWVGFADSVQKIVAPTHWMPLPKPPVKP